MACFQMTNSIKSRTSFLIDKYQIILKFSLQRVGINAVSLLQDQVKNSKVAQIFTAMLKKINV